MKDFVNHSRLVLKIVFLTSWEASELKINYKRLKIGSRIEILFFTHYLENSNLKFENLGMSQAEGHKMAFEGPINKMSKGPISRFRSTKLGTDLQIDCKVMTGFFSPQFVW